MEEKKKSRLRFTVGSARNSSNSERPDAPSKEKIDLYKVELERDQFKRDCEHKEQQIKNYQDTLVQYEAQLRIQLSKVEELEKQQLKKDEETQKSKLTETQLKESLEEKEKKLAETTKTVDDLGFELAKKVDDLCQKALELEGLNLELAKQEKQLETLEKHKTVEKQVEELVERIKLKEAENAIYKQDFETERNDRQRIHDEYEVLKFKYEELKTNQEQSIDLKSKQQSGNELDGVRQKLNASANIEEIILSKQKLDGELARMRQMLDNKEELLKSYHQEQANLKDQLEILNKECEGLKRANKVLKELVSGTKSSPHLPIGYQIDGATSQAQNTPHCHAILSNSSQASTRVDDETYDSIGNVEPQLTAEEMAALFKPTKPKNNKETAHDRQDSSAKTTH